MSAILIFFTALSLLIWLILWVLRGGFWRCDQRLGWPATLDHQPSVVAVVPARNEAEVVERSLSGLLAQDYAGEFRIILVDDDSEDGTGEIAARLSEVSGDRLVVHRAPPLPDGWSGKLWAVNAGLERARTVLPEAAYWLLTDADILHDPGSVGRLVAKAEADDRDLVSLMVLLDVEGPWAELLIPPFVYFFQKLYPFRWVNDPSSRSAAAAGGCMLVRRAALERSGGIAAIRGALIDDCALAARIKHGGGRGRIWLGLTARLISLRDNRRLSDLWTMVARTAFTQLDHSPVKLVGTVLGMIVTYLVPPLVVLSWPWHQSATAAVLALATWLVMCVTFTPTARLYGASPFRGALLPVAGLLYSLMTIDSALRHWRGRGGGWKGRTYSGQGAAQGAGYDLPSHDAGRE